LEDAPGQSAPGSRRFHFGRRTECVREQTFSLWAHPRGRGEGNYTKLSTEFCASVVSNLSLHFSNCCMMAPSSRFLDPGST
jgi:hypothetical protein